MADNTFLGLQPYTEDDAYRFKGRTEESQELFRLIVRNDFTVCYAESGEGKTSLLNAGVFPLLRENMYFPIAITFTSDDYKVTPDSFDSIIDRCVKDSIAEYNEKNKGVNVEYKLYSTDFQGLGCQAKLQQELSKFSWWKLRNYRPQAMGLTFTPVFVFDQFEEVFNLPSSIVWTKKFFDWLEDVSSDSCPDDIAKKVRMIIGDKAAFPAINEEKGFKAVFSLRKEFIGELDYWGMQTHFVPALKDNRYCLKALTYEGAKKVMTQQKRFDEGKVELVLTHFVGQYSREPGRTIAENLPAIPALLLSVVCDSWEKDVDAFAKLNTDEIGQSLNKILEMFYDETIEAVIKDPALKNRDAVTPNSIRKDIDTAMFDLVDVNGKRVRVKAVITLGTTFGTIMGTGNRYSERLLLVKYKEILNNYRIIKITKIDGEDYVEIVHDCLCPIIAKRKETRLAAEAKKREEQRLREQAKIQKKKIWIISFIFIFVIFCFGVFSFILYQDKQNWKLQKAQCRYIAAITENLTGDGDSYLAQLLILKGLPEDVNSPNRPYTPEAEASLRKANMCDNAIFYGHNDKATFVAFSPDDRYIASGSEDCTIRIWEAKTGLCVDTLIGHSGSIDYIKYSSIDSLLFSSGRDSTVRIWNLSTGECIFKNDNDKITKQTTWLSEEAKKRLFQKSGFECKRVFVSPGGDVLVAISDDKEAMIWDTKEEKCLCLLNGLGYSISPYRTSPVFSDDGALLAILDYYDDLLILDVRTGNCLKKIQSRHLYYDISHVSFSHNKRLLSAACTDGTIRVWDLNANSKVIHTYEGTDTLRLRKPEEQDHIVSSNGKYEAMVQDNYTISVIDTKNRTNTGILVGHTADISSIAFSPDGNSLASASWDATIRIWDVRSGKCKTILHANNFIVNCVQFSSDGKKVVSCSGDFNTIRVWDVTTGICLFSVEGTPMISDVCFSNEDKQIIFKSYGNIKSIDFPPLQELIDQTRERFKDRPLTPEEKRKYYLE